MKETQFQELMKSKYDFDINKNELFYQSVKAAMDEAERTTINGLPMIEYYDSEEYEKEFISAYISKLKLLISSAKMLNPGMTMMIHGIQIHKLVPILPSVEETVTNLEKKVLASQG